MPAAERDDVHGDIELMALFGLVPSGTYTSRLCIRGLCEVRVRSLCRTVRRDHEAALLDESRLVPGSPRNGETIVPGDTVVYMIEQLVRPYIPTSTFFIAPFTLLGFKGAEEIRQ